MQASDFGPKLFKQIRDSMISPTRTRQYVNKLMGRIRQFVKWCVAEELMEPGIYQAIKCVPCLQAGRTELEESKEVEPVELAIVEATIKKMPATLADMVRVQLLLGCRPGEVCQITPSMIDRSEAVWQIKLGQHKTAWRGKKRIIYAGPKAQEILAKYLDRSPDKALFSPREAMEQRRVAKAQERVTPRNQGNARGYGKRSRMGWDNYEVGDQYDTASYGKAISYACKLAKVKRWSPNQLRHAAATAIRKKFGIEAAQVILGHSELSVTQIYAEADRERAIEIAREVG